MRDYTGVELLAPAGTFEAAQTALRYGADAVYAGGPFLQLRAGQTAFTLEKIAETAALCHSQNKKLYIAANAFTFPEEIEKMGQYAVELKKAGADAMIVSDIGAIRSIKKACPDMEVHVSTQANCMNHETASAYYEMGARRVVLARELSLEQVKRLRDNTPADLEIEAFVHGAMCMAYSGRCMLSAYLTSRSANRGGCAQSCRWKFALAEEKRPGEYYPIEEDPDGDTIISSYDLCALPVLDELRDAGVTSFKIEGRMKTPYYVAGAVSAYRLYMDGGDYETSMGLLTDISHRPYSTGFYKGEIKYSIFAPAGYEKDCDYIGPVLDRTGDRLTVQVKNKLVSGQTVEALTPARGAVKFTAADMKNAEGEPIEAAAVPETLYTLPAPEGIEKGDFLRIRH